MRVTIACILLAAGVASLCAGAHSPPGDPHFSARVVDAAFPGAYGVAVEDVDGDEKPDILALGSAVAWYRNGDWQRFPIAATRGNVALATHNIDGDRKLDVVIASEFSLNPSDRGGVIQWFRRGADLSQPWTSYPIAANPTTHRVRFADLDGDGRHELVGIPIIGLGSRVPYQDVGARVTWYRAPADPASGPWEAHPIDDSLHVIHDARVVNFDRDRRDEILLPSQEGVVLVKASGRAPDLTFSSTRLGEGEQSRMPPQRGASEVGVGRLGRGREQRFLATIEPWHGDLVALYTPPKERGALWMRRVLDRPATDGHALQVADLDGDGADEIIAGFRGGQRLIVYRTPDGGATWQPVELDRASVSGLAVADLNGDRRPDLVAVGGGAVRRYENIAAAPRAFGGNRP